MDKKIKNFLARIREKRIGVLCGGSSSEREVSLKSGQAIFKALRTLGLKGALIDVDKDIVRKLKRGRVAIAFLAMHGPGGEDGTLQGLLEILRIPYTGSGVLSSALALNKTYTKKIFEYHCLPVPPWQILSQPSADLIEIGSLPLVIKPVNQGSTIGVSIVRVKRELKRALLLAFRYSGTVIVEKCIMGRELTVGILGDSPLPVIEIESPQSFYDFRAKYVPGASRHVLPAPLPSRIYKRIQTLALAAHQALSCKAISRVDIMVDRNLTPYILE